MRSTTWIQKPEAIKTPVGTPTVAFAAAESPSSIGNIIEFFKAEMAGMVIEISMKYRYPKGPKRAFRTGVFNSKLRLLVRKELKSGRYKAKCEV